MKDNIELSVIIPVYNAGKYLKQCIDSLVMQSLNEMEIIFVNDCSPCSDDEELIKNYMKKDGRIKYYKHEKTKALPEQLIQDLKIVLENILQL